MPFVDHILVFLFGLMLPMMAIFRSRSQLKAIESWDTDMKRLLYRSNSLFLWVIALVVLTAWIFTGRPISTLGFQWPESTALHPVLLLSMVFLVAYSADILVETATPKTLAKTREHWREHTAFMPENGEELVYFLPLALSAAICEEIFFRSFLIQYFMGWFGTDLSGKAIALTISTVIFSISHFYQGGKAVAKILVLSVAFGTIFLISKSLLIPILLHLLVDVAGGILGLLIMNQKED